MGQNPIADVSTQLLSAVPPASEGAFTEEQKQYLQGFFAGVAQRLPFVGQMPDGRMTHDAATGVGNVASFHGTEIDDLCAEEMWKYAKNPLDCWDALLEHAAEDKAPDAEFRYRFKTLGLFHVAPAQDSFMLRLRAPGGVLRSDQMRGLAMMAERWGSGRLDLTTRANVQIRELSPASIVDVLNTVQGLGMSSRGSGADNLRNLTASPISGLDARELIDTQPFADAMQHYISNSRDLYGLPRKFNIAFDGGGAISVLAIRTTSGFPR